MKHLFYIILKTMLKLYEAIYFQIRQTAAKQHCIQEILTNLIDDKNKEKLCSPCFPDSDTDFDFSYGNRHCNLSHTNSMMNTDIAPDNVSSTISAPALNEVYTFKKPYPQQFSISPPIIRYMIKNPTSGKVWKKLIATCKYFYSKYPVLPVRYVSVGYFGDMYSANGEKFDPSLYFPKLWVCESFYNAQGSGVNLHLISKIFKFELRSLNIGRQRFSLNDFKKLTSSGTIKELTFYRAFIVDNDESFVPFYKLIENLHNLESLDFDAYKDSEYPLFDANSAKKLIEHVTSCKNMRRLFFKSYAECIDFSFFTDFLLKNETIEVCFDFHYNASDAVRQMTENVLNEIRKNPRLKVPDIYIS